MIRNQLYTLVTLLLICSPALGVRHTAIRAPIPQRVARPFPTVHHSGVLAAKNRVLTRRYSTEHEGHTEAKRQEAWLRMKMDVAERVSALKTKGMEHRAKSTQHTHHARVYDTLAELEKEKFELFQITIEKLNEAAMHFEEPNIETEANLMKVLTETYEEFYEALPLEEKLNLENKF